MSTRSREPSLRRRLLSSLILGLAAPLGAQQPADTSPPVLELDVRARFIPRAAEPRFALFFTDKLRLQDGLELRGRHDFLLADVSERGRRGSVVTSWLLSAMRRGFGGHVEKK